jgi:hypothetical protein
MTLPKTRDVCTVNQIIPHSTVNLCSHNNFLDTTYINQYYFYHVTLRSDDGKGNDTADATIPKLSVDVQLLMWRHCHAAASSPF